MNELKNLKRGIFKLVIVSSVVRRKALLELKRYEERYEDRATQTVY